MRSAGSNSSDSESTAQNNDDAISPSIRAIGISSLPVVVALDSTSERVFSLPAINAPLGLSRSLCSCTPRRSFRASVEP